MSETTAQQPATETAPRSDARTRRAPAAARPAPPCTLVILGARGDLTRRLLIPAIYNLASQGLLDDGFRIVGADHNPGTSQDWEQALAASMQNFTKDPAAEFYVPQIDAKVWDWMAERLTFVQADFTSAGDMRRLADRVRGSAIFYLAVPPRFFGAIIDNLADARAFEESDGVFRRVVIEKPFGSDLASARQLNARILRNLAEEQIFRIDHFLGKETVQNIMALRFANGLFEPIWRREYIDYVEITAAETIGVEGRGAFYEPTGALRDMVPNHLFQLLTMVAMEPPSSFDAEQVRNAKEQVLYAIVPLTAADVARGQYAAGTRAGAPVPAYRSEPNVAPDSQTETYVALRLEIENWRWAGVPFYLRTGKRLKARHTQIVLHFRAAPFAMFKGTSAVPMGANTLTFDIQPRQGMKLSLNVKHPGPEMTLSPVDMDFRYQDAFAKIPNVGYETLLYDCLTGDTTLFQRADMIEAGWAAVAMILDPPEGPPLPLETYEAGSDGPSCARALLAKTGHAWTPLT